MKTRSIAVVDCARARGGGHSGVHRELEIDDDGLHEHADHAPVRQSRRTVGAEVRRQPVGARVHRWCRRRAHGTPITIGYANQEDVFPEATIGIDAAVKYVNAELGGIGGHPIKLTTCKITVEEDGQKCGTQFVNDSNVSVVMTGTLLVGGKGLYDTLAGKKPVVVGNGLTTDDFTTHGRLLLVHRSGRRGGRHGAVRGRRRCSRSRRRSP